MVRENQKLMSVLFATKSLFIVPISDSKYVVQDALGNSSLPHVYRDRADLERSLQANFRVRPLVPIEEQLDHSSLTTFRWGELEHWYVAHLDYALHEHILAGNQEQFHVEAYGIPIAYSQCGHGDGSRETLELVDKFIRGAISEGKLSFTASTLETWLVLEQTKRIFSELMSLLHRAIDSFLELLTTQRDCVRAAFTSLAQLNANEVIHRGRDSHRASTAATMAAISLCTSLDIQSKLIHYLDQVDKIKNRFKPAGGRHFSDLRKFKPRRLPTDIHENLLQSVDRNPAIAELIQFRHDVVHSTSAIELEKVYVGFATPEIKDMPLHYSFQGWRDCTTSGQPERYLGRDYFVGGGQDIEYRVFTWIQDVIGLHLEMGERIHSYLKSVSASELDTV